MIHLVLAPSTDTLQSWLCRIMYGNSLWLAGTGAPHARAAVPVLVRMPSQLTRPLLTLLVAVGLSWPGLTLAAPPALLKVNLQGQWVTGRVLRHDQATCWLVEPIGRLHEFSISEVQQFEPLPQTFQAASVLEVRERLQKEFPTEDVASSGRYVVVAPRGRGPQLANFFDQLHRDVEVTLRARNLPIRPTEFPLIAILLPSYDAFVAYCRTEGFVPPPGVAGYYMPSSNRVALFEDERLSLDVDSTIVHEAFHQVAFNVGLHARDGFNPRWMVEGLAMTFEPPGFRDSSPQLGRADRINRERWVTFTQNQSTRPAGWLKELVADERIFRSAPLEAYARSWALTFFLLETRGPETQSYLKDLATHISTDDGSAASRVALFEKRFGRQWHLLEAELDRFHERLLDSN